jgi:signal transduction histidine kinase
LEETVLVLAPLGRDAELACHTLEGAGFGCHPCRDMSELLNKLAFGVAALLVTEEALTGRNRELLLHYLDAQPPWSDLPVILLLSALLPESRPALELQAILPGRNVTVLRRPVGSSTLVSVMNASVRARRRQYQVREHLKERENQAAELEQRVEERTRDLQELTSALTMAEQAERHRISQVLHDDLQQRLYALQFLLVSLEAALEEGDTEGALAELSEMKDGLQQSVELTRRLSVDLSPPILHDEGMTEAIGWLANQMRDQYGFEVEVQVKAEDNGRRDSFPIDDDGLRVLLFQAVRELLFNVVKHADTSFAVVTLEHVGECIHIQVQDFGTGFESSSVLSNRQQVHGLSTIQRRLQMVGGRMEVESAPGQGTRTTIIAPQ